MHLLSANIAEFAFYRFLLCPAVGHRILENEFVNSLVFVKSIITLTIVAATLTQGLVVDLRHLS